MKLLVLTIACLPLVWTVPTESYTNSKSKTLGEENLGRRIIGGLQARAGQFPFAVAIRVATSDSSIFCGGALISTRWVLTAAHCIQNATILNITVGSIYLTEEDNNRLILSTSSYFLHPDFNTITFENDIALIEFRQDIEYTEYIDKIHLPIVAYGADKSVTAIGWGQTSDSQAGPEDRLNYVEMITLSNEECKIYYGSQITDSMICVAGQNIEGICTGDSGSPLVYFLDSRHPIVIGIATFHSGVSCEGIEPSGYTRTFPYIDWIFNVTGGVDK
ncbi:hypothetical protein Zmor_015483 [Zophobas morio]|uniref:Peptidase S1 domain-containing protein n=1 Tax=Zophobas morio TaxID=2755281 RepID=A0AA38IJ77_9CUCU|nr:hypothetical protein Zmor_015483 [Zophobas morio]